MHALFFNVIVSKKNNRKGEVLQARCTVKYSVEKLTICVTNGMKDNRQVATSVICEL